jgi:hypothetical protein
MRDRPAVTEPTDVCELLGGAKRSGRAVGGGDPGAEARGQRVGRDADGDQTTVDCDCLQATFGLVEAQEQLRVGQRQWTGGIDEGLDALRRGCAARREL